MAEVGIGQPDGEGEEEDEVRFTLVGFPNPAPDFQVGWVTWLGLPRLKQ